MNESREQEGDVPAFGQRSFSGIGSSASEGRPQAPTLGSQAAEYSDSDDARLHEEPVASRSAAASRYASSLPENERIRVLTGQMQSLSASARNEVFERSGIQAASQVTSDRVWLIVVSALAVVLVGAFTTLAVGMFSSIKEGAVKPELIFAIFTSIIGFLGGIFVPSPVRRASARDA